MSKEKGVIPSGITPILSSFLRIEGIVV